MANQLHGYVLCFASVPSLVSSYMRGSELSRLQLVRAELELIRSRRLAGLTKARAQFDKKYQVFLAAREAQGSGSVSFEVHSALYDDASAPHEADQLHWEIKLMIVYFEKIIVNYDVAAPQQSNRRVHGYTLSLCMARALLHLSLIRVDMTRLLVLRGELRAL